MTSTEPPAAGGANPILTSLGIDFTNTTEWATFTAGGETTPIAHAASINLAGGGACTDDFRSTGAVCTTDSKTPATAWPPTDGQCVFFKLMTENIGFLSARYSGCTGDAPEKTKFDSMAAFFTAYTTASTDPQYSSYNGKTPAQNWKTEIYNREVEILTNIKNSITTIDEIKVSVSKIGDTINSMASDIFEAFNCRIIRREFGILQNVLCYQFSLNIARFSYSVALMGFCIFWYSCCLCCTIRCKRANEKPKESPGMGDNKVMPKGGNGGGKVAYY